MDHIPHIYCINLDHRTDRYANFQRWVSESGFPLERVKRISAAYVPGRGHIGCLLSHIQTLQAFLQSNEQVCMVCEDDYEPLENQRFWKTIERPFLDNVPFDLLMLAFNVLRSEPTQWSYLEHVLHSYTSSGYIVTREFAPRLLENFMEAVQLCVEKEEKTHKKECDYCLDVYWQRLMPSSKWYCFVPRLGKQIASYSDCELGFTDHGV